MFLSIICIYLTYVTFQNRDTKFKFVFFSDTSPLLGSEHIFDTLSLEIEQMLKKVSFFILYKLKIVFSVFYLLKIFLFI